MNSQSKLLQTLLENAFLNTIIPSVGIIGVTCEKIFGRGTTAVVTENTPEGFTLELTAKGATTAIYFKTSADTLTEGSVRITGIEL